MLGDMEVRDARVEEFDTLLGVMWRASLLWDDTRHELLAHPDAVTFPVEQIEQGCVRVAVIDDHAVGFCAVVPTALDAARELDGLFVEPDFMQRGVGRLLIADAVARSGAAGGQRLEVTANINALPFYEKVGFVVVGETPTRFGPALRMHLQIRAVG